MSISTIKSYPCCYILTVLAFIHMCLGAYSIVICTKILLKSFPVVLIAREFGCPLKGNYERSTEGLSVLRSDFACVFPAKWTSSSSVKQSLCKLVQAQSISKPRVRGLSVWLVGSEPKPWKVPRLFVQQRHISGGESLCIIIKLWVSIPVPILFNF